MPEYDFLVGTFNTPHIYTLTFSLPSSSSSDGASLTITKRHDAVGSHSWLHLTPPYNTADPQPAQPRASSGTTGRRNLYATAWTEPPSVVAYAVESATSIKLLGQGRTRTRSGYVTASDRAVYSAGGATGEVFAINPATGAFVSPAASHDSSLSSTPLSSSESGSSSSSSPPPVPPAIVEPVQVLSFVESTGQQKDDGSVLDFGGLRHGAHSADLSPDGGALYVADIGRNAIWTYTVDRTAAGADAGKLTLAQKLISPRPNDGPRHVWPHPAGRVVYVLQEHSSHVDVFDVVHTGGAAAAANVELRHAGAVRIVPDELSETLFWADEVRTSLSGGARPRWAYASTRGLEPHTKGWLAVFALDADGHIDAAVPKVLWETPTSGGWANAVQPGPTVDGVEYLALTDSEQGWVFVVGWDGHALKEVARQQLDPGAGAATAVWL